MEHPQNDLRNRFTAWLETLVRRARIDYIRRYKVPFKNDISLELCFDDESLKAYDQFDTVKSNETQFEFTNARMSEAFFRLSLRRQKILSMLFIEEKEPEEIAVELGCTVQNIYNQRSLAIKQIKEFLDK